MEWRCVDVFVAHREEQDAADEGEEVESDAPALRMAHGPYEVIHAGLAQQRQRLEDAEHDHEVVDAVGVGPCADDHGGPQDGDHREEHEHDLRGTVGQSQQWTLVILNEGTYPCIASH